MNEITGVKSLAEPLVGPIAMLHPLSQVGKIAAHGWELEQIPEWDSVSSEPTVCEEQWILAGQCLRGLALRVYLKIFTSFLTDAP